MSAPALIAIDWGTSSARAYLLGAAGEVLEEHRSRLGIMHVPEGGFPAAFATLVGAWAKARPGMRAIACGMIGSRQGWREAPYLACPFAPPELARALVDVDTGLAPRLSIVPGARCEGHWGPDVMRGEETQLLGAVEADEVGPDGSALVALPGTHSKWVRLELGRVAAFRTFMTGELFGVLREHSILGRLMEAPGEAGGGAATGEGFARGVRAGLDARGDLAAKLFSARTLPLLGRVDAGAVADYLSGLIIGAEVREALAWASEGQRLADGATVARTPAGAAPLLVGEPALCARYAEACRLAGVAAPTAAPGAAARGLWTLARLAAIAH